MDRLVNLREVTENPLRNIQDDTRVDSETYFSSGHTNAYATLS
jgi:hypothetical protein